MSRSLGLGLETFAYFWRVSVSISENSVSEEVSILVSENLVPEKKYLFGLGEFGRGKKSLFRFRKIHG